MSGIKWLGKPWWVTTKEKFVLEVCKHEEMKTNDDKKMIFWIDIEECLVRESLFLKKGKLHWISLELQGGSKGISQERMILP